MFLSPFSSAVLLEMGWRQFGSGHQEARPCPLSRRLPLNVEFIITITTITTHLNVVTILVIGIMINIIRLGVQSSWLRVEGPGP